MQREKRFPGNSAEVLRNWSLANSIFSVSAVPVDCGFGLGCGRAPLREFRAARTTCPFLRLATTGRCQDFSGRCSALTDRVQAGGLVRGYCARYGTDQPGE